MLDAYIIDRMRRERESREPVRTPLRIEVPRPEVTHDERPLERERDDEPVERGVVIVDFTI